MCYKYVGDGKTHYIEKELAMAPAHLKIAVNEAFTPLGAIKKLTSELPTDIPNCAIYFNFTMLPPGVRTYRFKVQSLRRFKVQVYVGTKFT